MTQTKTREELLKEQDVELAVHRSLIHTQIASYSLQELAASKLHKPMRNLPGLAEEVAERLGRTIRKLEWFIGIAKRAVPTPLAAELERDLDITEPRLCNIANLNEWIIDAPENIDNEIDLIVNGSRRRELMLRSWRAALGILELTEYDQMRFNAWYNANFHSKPHSFIKNKTP